jgi:DNA-binding MarR family transcriptional regulator
VILSARGSINIKTPAGLLHVQRSTTGRMVERLITAGLIDRRPHPTLRRELVVELTRRGQELVQAVTAHRREEIARRAKAAWAQLAMSVRRKDIQPQSRSG